MTSEAPNRVPRGHHPSHAAVAVAMGISWPLLDLLGRNPAFFVARGAAAADFLLTGAAVAIALPGIAAAFGAFRIALGRVIAFAITVIGWSALIAPRLPADLGSLNSAGLALSAGAVITYVVGRTAALGNMIRLLAWSPIVFLILFGLSPSGDLLRPSPFDPRPSTSQSLGSTPIVLLVFDEFPLAALTHPSGALLADDFPGFGRLAADGVWFRNAATIEAQTIQSVPAIFTGIDPPSDRQAIASQYSGSLFTTFRQTHDLNVLESVTAMCSECGQHPAWNRPWPERVMQLVSDVSVVAGRVSAPPSMAVRLPDITQAWGGFTARRFNESTSDRQALIEDFIESIVISDRPTLSVIHVLLPHAPLEYLPNGDTYRFLEDPPIVALDNPPAVLQWAEAQEWQQRLLQIGYADTVLTQLMMRLDELGIYEQATVVVTADHGVAVGPTFPGGRRQVSTSTIGAIAPVPMFIKSPGLEPGQIDDYRALTVDLAPTLAGLQGTTLGYPIDGVDLFGARRPPRGFSTIAGPGLEMRWPAESRPFGGSARIEDLIGETPWTEVVPHGGLFALGDALPPVGASGPKLSLRGLAVEQGEQARIIGGVFDSGVDPGDTILIGFGETVVGIALAAADPAGNVGFTAFIAPRFTTVQQPETRVVVIGSDGAAPREARLS